MKSMERVNNDGVSALNPIKYSSLYDGEKELQRCDLAWWQNSVVIIFIVIALSCLDAATLYSVIDTVMVENQYIGKFMVGGLALTLNFIPLIVGYLLRERYYEKSRIPIWTIIALAITFTLLFAAVFYLRWETRALSFSGIDNLLVDTTSQNNLIQNSTSEDSAIATSLTLLLGFTPLVTSIINVYLGYISDDPIRKKINKLRLRRLEIQEMLCDLEAARSEMEQERISQLMMLDSERFICAKEEIIARCEKMKKYARLKLAEYLKEPQKISRLTNNQEVSNIIKINEKVS